MSVVAELPFDTLLGKEGTLPTSSLEGKIVGLYFSAHWCAPCREFTPQLAAKYTEVIKQGHNFEIIFISLDRDERAALSYFATMPWKMLPYEDRDSESELSDKYDLSGVPNLVLLDTDGSVLSPDCGDLFVETPFEELRALLAAERAKEDSKGQQIEEARTTFNVTTFFTADNDVIDSANKTLTAADLTGKIVGLYFSAHWCPPCRHFTPQLADLYRKYTSEGKAFEIIYISGDRSQEEARAYYAEMPWKMLRFDAVDKRELLDEIFEVTGIPSLILFDENSKLITKDGREAILSLPFERLRSFEEERARAAAEVAAMMASFPETVTLAAHEHSLRKLPSIYNDTGYGCDICTEGGRGWVYHCADCGFDVHPNCAVSLCLPTAPPSTA